MSEHDMALVELIVNQQKMVDINRESIRTITNMLDLVKDELREIRGDISCLKQDS